MELPIDLRSHGPWTEGPKGRKVATQRAKGRKRNGPACPTCRYEIHFPLSLLPSPYSLLPSCLFLLFSLPIRIPTLFRATRLGGTRTRRMYSTPYPIPTQLRKWFGLPSTGYILLPPTTYTPDHYRVQNEHISFLLRATVEIQIRRERRTATETDSIRAVSDGYAQGIKDVGRSCSVHAERVIGSLFLPV